MRSTKRRAVDLMLDSGAFSAWRLGKPIDVREYIAYIRDHLELLDTYVSLDVIPGEAGRIDASQRAIKASAEASYRNHQIMKDAGLSPIPVFHQGEEWSVLERYIDDGEPYVGISPRVYQYTRVRSWLDSVFARITDARGRPVIKTHGFGTTDIGVVTTYPWYSVDSTSWSQGPYYGLIRIPRIGRDGQFVYGGRGGRLVYLGSVGLEAGSSTPQFDALSQREQDVIIRFIEDVCGLSLIDVRTDKYARKVAFVTYQQNLLAELAATRKQWVFKPLGASFWRDADTKAEGEVVSLRYEYACQPGSYWDALLLTRLNVRDRLMSYFYTKGLKADALAQYVQDGFIGDDMERVKRKPKPDWKSFYTDYRRQLIMRRFDGQEADS